METSPVTCRMLEEYEILIIYRTHVITDSLTVISEILKMPDKIFVLIFNLGQNKCFWDFYPFSIDNYFNRATFTLF